VESAVCKLWHGRKNYILSDKTNISDSPTIKRHQRQS
jgi:hypothetical protein